MVASLDGVTESSGADVSDHAGDAAADPSSVSATPPESAVSSSDRPSSRRLDRALTVAVWIVAVALVAFAAFFAYSVYAQRQADRLTSPALVTIDNAQKAVDKSPNDLGLRIQLAAALGAARLFDQAKAQLAVVIKSDAKNVAAYQTLAEIELLQEDYANAKGHLQTILDLTGTGEYQNVNQRREVAYFHLGEIALIKHEYEDAVGYFKAALRIRRDASDTYLRLAQAYVGLEAPDKALEQIDIALAFDPKLPEAHFEKGKILLAKGDKPGAAAEFRVALDGAPESREAQGAIDALGTFADWYRKAQAAFTAGQLPAALDAVRVARAIDPASYDAAMLDGRILDAMRDFSGASDAYSVALKVKPDDKPATEALARSQEASRTKDAQ